MHTLPRSPERTDAGFSLVEALISTALLMVVSGVVIGSVLNLTQLNLTNLNRGDMFAAVRNASALIQQEVGQAGRISLQNPVRVAANTGAPGLKTITIEWANGDPGGGATPTSSMFQNEKLDIGSGADKETVMLTAAPPSGTTITAVLTKTHPAGAPIAVYGGFHHGVIPPVAAVGAIPGFPNGSDGNTLKLFGDISGDGDGYGKMQYIEYTCDPTVTKRLTRVAMDFDAAVKTPPTVEHVLVDNLTTNPNGTPCFSYQTKNTQGRLFVTGVAVTLTVESRVEDPVTGKKQKESKALLSVSPRNVFNVWQFAGLNLLDRVQSTPFSVASTLMLPTP